MKTNVKILRNPPAVVYITPENFSLNYHHQGKEFSVDSSILLTGLNDGIENKVTAVLNQTDHCPCTLIIILSAELTLYSEQVFPCDLSDTQIGELLMLQFEKRTESGVVNTLYDYFLLRKSQASCIYGLIEARKDLLNTWMNIFENHGFRTVAIVSQPIVLINYIMRNININADWFQIVCLLPARILIVHVDEHHVEKITEHVAQGDQFNAGSLAKLIADCLDQDIRRSNHPIIFLDTIDSGITDEFADNFMNFPGFHTEQVLGENTIKWLRAENDMYKSVALA